MQDGKTSSMLHAIALTATRLLTIAPETVTAFFIRLTPPADDLSQDLPLSMTVLGPPGALQRFVGSS
jgi:hypothetical protein